MVLKYKVPPPYYEMFENKKAIYCKVISITEAVGKKVYLVKMINLRNITNVFADNELTKLNIIDKIKLLKIWRKKI